MKKITVFALVALLICTAVLSAACGETEHTDELVVYNWADYIYDTDLEDFKTYYKNLTGNNINVTYVTFDTNETMLTKILNGDSVVDVMCPSEYAIQKLLEQDMLLPLNYFSDDVSDYIDTSSLNGYVHNSGNVDSDFVSKVSEVFSNVTVGGKTVDMTQYFVPYMYGTLGILYNKQYFEELGIYDRDIMNDANWGLLFNDDGSGNVLSDGLTGRIYMKDSTRDSYAATVFYLKESGRLDGKTVQDQSSAYYGKLYTDLPIGELINTVDDQLVELCSEVLKAQKSDLYGYEVDFGKNELIQGIAYVDLAWSGDALYAVEESWDDDYIDPMLDYEEGESGGYTLGYYVPHDSGNIWFDGWVIPKTCKNLTAAKIFINFLNQPDIAALNMMEIGYTSAVSAEALLASDEACAALCESYVVYAPEYWDAVDENGNALSADECDYASWEEFVDYFFYYVDPIDDSNWRYPFKTASDTEYNRSPESTLGVMRDFGANNTKVVTMWEDVRSTGITAWALLGWTLLVIGVACAIVALCLLVSRRKKMRVVTKPKQDKSQ